MNTCQWLQGKGESKKGFSSQLMSEIKLLQDSECPVGIETDKKHFVVLEITLESVEGRLLIDLGIAKINVFKVCSQIQARTPLVLRADRVPKLPIDGEVGRSIFGIHGAGIIRKPGHEKPWL